MRSIGECVDVQVMTIAVEYKSIGCQRARALQRYSNAQVAIETERTMTTSGPGARPRTGQFHHRATEPQHRVTQQPNSA